MVACTADSIGSLTTTSHDGERPMVASAPRSVIVWPARRPRQRLHVAAVDEGIELGDERAQLAMHVLDEQRLLAFDARQDRRHQRVQQLAGAAGEEDAAEDDE